MLYSTLSDPSMNAYYQCTVHGNAPSADKNATVTDAGMNEPAGCGNGGGNTIYRLKDGIERFLITDVNNAGSASVSQSSVWVMFDLVTTTPTAFNHIPGGGNVLYMDGHVSFMKYDEKGDAPVNGRMAVIVGLLTSNG